MKEVFAQHQQEQDDVERYYSEMYQIAKYMGTEKLFHELYQATAEPKNNNKLKEKKNVRK